jgi:hypothetical protein
MIMTNIMLRMLPGSWLRTPAESCRTWLEFEPTPLTFSFTLVHQKRLRSRLGTYVPMDLMEIQVSPSVKSTCMEGTIQHLHRTDASPDFCEQVRINFGGFYSNGLCFSAVLRTHIFMILPT